MRPGVGCRYTSLQEWGLRLIPETIGKPADEIVVHIGRTARGPSADLLVAPSCASSKSQCRYGGVQVGLKPFRLVYHDLAAQPHPAWPLGVAVARIQRKKGKWAWLSSCSE